MRYKWAIVVFLAFGFSWYCAERPRGNADLLAYVSEMLRFDWSPQTLDDFKRFHAQIYGSVHERATPEQWLDLTQASEKRREGSDPVTGPQVLYKNHHMRKFGPRLLYTIPSYVLWKCGVHIAYAPFLVSSIFAGLCLWPLFVLAGRTWLALMAGFMAMMCWRLAPIGYTASPDTMLALLALLALAYRNRKWALVLVVLMPLARPNAILFSCLIVWFMAGRLRWKLTALGLALAIYFGLGAYFHVPSWNDWFWRDVVVPSYRLPQVAYGDPVPHVTWPIYKACIWGRKPLLWMTEVRYLWLVVALAALRVRRKMLPVLVLPVLYLLGTYVVFPYTLLRFFVWVYLAVTMVVVNPEGE